MRNHTLEFCSKYKPKITCFHWTSKLNTKLSIFHTYCTCMYTAIVNGGRIFVVVSDVIIIVAFSRPYTFSRTIRLFPTMSSNMYYFGAFSVWVLSWRATFVSKWTKLWKYYAVWLISNFKFVPLCYFQQCL